MVRPIDSNGYIPHPPRVHFSPVVSQLRYNQQQQSSVLRPSRKSNSVKIQDNYNNHHTGHTHPFRDQVNILRVKGDERVTVQVQEVIVPPPPPVQKVQVTVPSRSSFSDRYTSEVNVPTSSISTPSTRSYMMDHPLSSTRDPRTLEKAHHLHFYSPGQNVNPSCSPCGQSSVPCGQPSIPSAQSSISCGQSSIPRGFSPYTPASSSLHTYPSSVNTSNNYLVNACPEKRNYTVKSHLDSIKNSIVTKCNTISNSKSNSSSHSNSKSNNSGSIINKTNQSSKEPNQSHYYGYEYYGYNNYGLPAVPSSASYYYDYEHDHDHDQPWVPVPGNQSCQSKSSISSITDFDASHRLDQGAEVDSHRKLHQTNYAPQAECAQQRLNSRYNVASPTQASLETYCASGNENNSISSVKSIKGDGNRGRSVKTKDNICEPGIEIGGSRSESVLYCRKWIKRNSEDKVKKGNNNKSVNSNNNKLSFLQRFTLGKLGKQSSKSKKSLSSRSSGLSGSSTFSKTSTSSSGSQVVPVSTWPVKSITGVVVLESEEESPVSNSCSSCGELWEGRRRNIKKGKGHSSGTTGAGREDNSGISHNTRQSKATNGLSVNSPYQPALVNGDSIEFISWEDGKRGFFGRGSSSSVGAGKGNENLVRSHIPGTDTWDPQTADQSHFIKVGNERAAAGLISDVEIPLSRTNYPRNSHWRDGDGNEAGKLGRQEDANKSIKLNNAGSHFENKNVATSPIHHLSAFYALNLPIVPTKFNSSLSTELEEEVPPVPKPRTRRLRKSSLEESKVPCDTDELSANVDRILDEIAGLELECMKMEQEGKLLQGDYLHDGDNKENEQRFAKSQSSTLEMERLWMELHNHQPRHAEKVGPVGKPPLPPSAKSTAASRLEFFSNSPTGDPRLFGKPGMSGTDLDVKLLKFRVQLYQSREELAKSHPNLEEIEDTVRSSMVIDRSSRQRTLPLSLCRGSENPEISPGYTTTHVSGQIHRHTPDPVTIEKERYRSQEWSNLCSRVNQNFLRSPPSNNNRHGNTSGPLHFTGIVETDLDTGASREIVGGDKQLCFESYGQQQQWTTNDQGNSSRDNVKTKNLPLSIFPDDGRLSYSLNQKTQSMLNLGSPTSTMSHKEKSATIASTSSAKGAESGTLSVASASTDERARSLEFLLEDSDKNAHLRPPENNLMMRQEGRQLSEHELRIQRSLSKLNVPDWYKKYSTGETDGGASAGGSAAGSKSKIFGSGSGLAGGWSGLSTSKTSSLTSLQSTGRTHFSRLRSTGTASTGARSSRESLMSPSSTASASPSPYYERSSFTYGMPYALTRFASARMSCGASPASLSPSPSPVGGVGGSSTSTPVSSAPLSRHHSYSKAPYLGWRSQERLTSKSMYRSPSERLAADLLAQKSKASASSSTASTPKEGERATPEIHLEVSPKKETVSTSDLSLNNSEESNSHKLNRVRSSIKEVSNAIVDYVNESKPLDDGINGGSSPRKGFVWLESSFVGTKPIDSPGTPDTPAMFMTANRQLPAHESGSSSSIGRPRHVFRFDDEHSSSFRETGFMRTSSPQAAAKNDSALASTNNGSSSTYSTPYHSRNEQMEERSNSSSVSSPTLEDILDSLLALRRPHKKIRARSGKGHSREPAPTPIPPPHLDPTPVSDWQERMNQPVLDTAYFPINDEFFPTTAVTATTVTTSNITSANNYSSDSYNVNSLSSYNNVTTIEDNVGGGDDTVETYNCTTSVMFTGSNGEQMASVTKSRGTKVPEPVSVEDYSVVVELGRTDPPQGEDVVDKEEDLFGIPTEICTAASSTSAANAMASVNDSTPPTPARHRRVSFDLDISDKEEKSSSRSNRRDESVGGTIHCRNSKCGKSASGLEARREFKTCHNCNAYYCSRECRRAHWDKHKKVCMQSRVGALCKQIINHVKEDSFVVSQLSAVARRGFLAKGRGCVKLFFSSPDRAERFLTGGLPELPEPWYIPFGDILPEEMGAQTFSELSEQCRTYNGDNRFVLYVSVCVVNEVPTSGAVKWEREMISRSSKLRLLLPRNYEETQMHHQAASTAHLFPEEPCVPAYHQDSDSNSGAQDDLPPPPPPNGSDNETLILRSVPAPTSRQLSSDDHKKLREVSFANIQKHLVERGVDLHGTYPEIYSKLCNYVEHDEPFLPVTIYPKNCNTGDHFVCVIMPESSDSTLEDYATRSDKVETVNISESSYDLC